MTKREELAIARALRARRDASQEQLDRAEAMRAPASVQVFRCAVATTDAVSLAIARELSGPGGKSRKGFDRERFLVATGAVRLYRHGLGGAQ